MFVLIFSYTVMNRPRRPTDHLTAVKDSINTKFFIKQPLRNATEFLSKLLVQMSVILSAFASAKSVFKNGFAIVFACHNKAHISILITGRIDILTCHSPEEGKSSVQCKTKSSN